MINFTKADRTQISAIRAIADKWEPRIANRFLDAVKSLQDSIDLNQLQEDVETYGQSYAEQLINEKALETFYAAVGVLIAEATIDAGKTLAPIAAKQIRTPTTAIGGFEVRFNSLNPKTQEYLQSASATLIRQITEETRTTVNQIVSRGVTTGKNPLDIARDIRANIGLTAKQEQAVDNFRQMLMARDRSVLDRALRDKRFDATIRRAIENEVPLSREQIDRMVGRYRQRYQKYRSEVIGRTEAMRAASSGSDQLWQQQVDEGLVRPGQIRREWVYTRDGRTRDSHVAIPRMNPDGVGLNEAFQTPDGPLMYPHDPNGPARATVQCRCTVFTRVLSEELIGL